jgi:hypothetical protein
VLTDGDDENQKEDLTLTDDVGNPAEQPNLVAACVCTCAWVLVACADFGACVWMCSCMCVQSCLAVPTHRSFLSLCSLLLASVLVCAWAGVCVCVCVWGGGFESNQLCIVQPHCGVGHRVPLCSPSGLIGEVPGRAERRRQESCVGNPE